jgi:hypothetical protein
MAIVMTTVVAALALSWNWRRLGKPGWALPSALGQVITIGLLIGAVALSAAVSAGGPISLTPLPPIVLVTVFVAMLNFGYPYFLWRMQAPAHKAFQEKGQRAMLAHVYPWARNFGLYLAVTALFTGGMTVLVTSRAQPREFNDGWLALTIPSGWDEVALNQVESCNGSDPNLNCRLYLTRGSFGSNQMLFATVNVSAGFASARDFADGIWYALDADASFTPLDMGEYTVGGKPGYFINYETAEGTYQTDLVIEAGSQLVYISVAAYSRESMDASWPQIDGILQSMQFLDGRGA